MAIPGLKVTIGTLGPQHKFIENEFYRLETLPKSGQIWHVWNKQGSNTSWHHEEWADNVDKGGDPCHWAPNCWIAYPERLKVSKEINVLDWHYVFGWDNPETEMREEGNCLHIIRRGIVHPHPEHTDTSIPRDSHPIIWAEVHYKFWADSALFWQSSTIRTLAPTQVFFIRNCQFVFMAKNFTHLLICPESQGLKPDDIQEPMLVPLMANVNAKPFVVEHTFSNILPSKLNYTGFVNEKTKDGFALFQLVERNTNLKTGKAALQNHFTIFTELKDWAAYFCRCFSYTNQRFNPENLSYLPEGEEYYEENAGFFFNHNGNEETLELLEKTGVESRKRFLKE